ncbi:MAG: c-type cytochrome [Pseudomonadota bacterium]
MSVEQDKRFFDVFMVVLAILVAISVAIYVVAAGISDNTQARYIAEDEAYQQQVAARIMPVGQVIMPGEKANAVAQAVVAPEPVAVTLTGAQVYNNACGACHTGGVAGAPKLGDAGAWEPRIAQGLETLRDHAVNGYQGNAGYMPAKGGNPSLSDDDVYNAIDYMLEESGQ